MNTTWVPTVQDSAPCPNKQGPQFGPVFMSAIDISTYLAFFLGVVLYNKFLSQWRFRKLFVFSQVLMVAFLFLDLVLVERWNLLISLPDELFVLGDKTVNKVAKRFFYMPMFVLAAKLCPPGTEATLFATIMALSNFGSDVAQYIGIGLLKAFGVGENNNYSNFGWVIVCKMGIECIPIILTFFLIPDANPEDDLLKGRHGNAEEEDATTSKSVELLSANEVEDTGDDTFEGVKS